MSRKAGQWVDLRMVPWFVAFPRILREEIADLSSAFPEMRCCESQWAEGRLVFHGALTIWLGKDPQSIPILIEYPGGYPYVPPRVVPLMSPLPGAEESSDCRQSTRARFFSVRHQMADGSLCLFEQEHGDDLGRQTGKIALIQAETWLRVALRGAKFPPMLDSREADLESHYTRHGDILMGAAGFRSDLPAEGEFFARNIRGEKLLPLLLVMYVQTTSGFVDEKLLWHRILGVEWPTEYDQLPRVMRAALPPEMFVARWFTLAEEPPPIRRPADLASLLFPGEPKPIDQLAAKFAIERGTRRDLVVALRYPARDGSGFQWLCLSVVLREATIESVVPPGGTVPGLVLDISSDREKWSIEKFSVLKVQDLRRSSLQLRNRGRVPSSTESFGISLLGAGALGSACATLFGGAGLSRIHVQDNGILDAGNLIRHAGDIYGVGHPKAWVVKKAIALRNPYCEISIDSRSCLDSGIDTADPFFSVAPIVSTIADDAQELAFNRIAVTRGVTVYYLRALRSATVGRLFRVRPNEDACFECLRLYAREGDPRFIQVPAAEDEVVARECGRPILAASGADLTVLAGLAVRQILAELSNPSAENHWLWSIEGVPGVAGLERPFTGVAAGLPPHPECSICGSNASEVVIPTALHARLLQLASEAAPNETGGLLIGRRKGAIVQVVEAGDAGPKAICTPARFQRDGEHSQALLKAAVARDRTLEYVGEWHSHPSCEAKPSDEDLTSLAEIALDPDYLTNCPVMLIVGGQSGEEVKATAHPQARAFLDVAFKIE